MATAIIISNPSEKSDVWSHFGFHGHEDGSILTKSRAVCCICYVEMPYKNNTTNLFSHLDRHHKKEYEEL